MNLSLYAGPSLSASEVELEEVQNNKPSGLQTPQG